MLHTTAGIVLHSFRYSDTSLIARVLTRNFGLQSYLVQGVYKSKPRYRASLFQPLTLIELVAYQKDNQGLQNVKEVRCTHPLANIATDIRKSSIAIFISEILLNVVKHQETNIQVFDFITRSVLRLDLQEVNLGVFHILFGMQLTKFTGFAPALNYSITNCYFHLREGKYFAENEKDDFCLNNEESLYFYHLSIRGYDDIEAIKLSPTMRKAILHRVVQYYRIHIDGFRDIKSLEVLETVFE